MTLLTSLLHREHLKDIIFRWMSNDFRQEDCGAVKRIVNFNVHILNLYLDDFSSDLFGYLSCEPVWTFVVTTKGALKDFVLDAASYHDDRLEYLTEKYNKYPEDFYKSTPFLGKVYCSGSQEHRAYLGHARIKRFRRVAEKVSRRMITIIFNEIKKGADDLARERASQLRIPKEELITPAEEEKAEFAHAERRFLKRLRREIFHPDEETLKSSAIHDIAGVKVILDDDKAAMLEAFLNDRSAYHLLEKEDCRGDYHATNCVVNLKIDTEALIRRPPDSRVVDVLVERGMDRATIISDYYKFIETAEDNVNLEVITSNYPDMIESEFGRSMHEERILSQRNQDEYRSSVARNVRYITEYLFLFAISGKKRIQQLPVRLWEKAMPDTYDHAIRALWDIPTMPVL